MKSASRLAIVLLSGVCALLGTPDAADACGGLLCNGGNPFNPVTVDQVGERVLFVMEDDGAGEALMTAVIEVQYTGNADDFAWILPVPSVPENIDVAPEDFFDQLDAATTPSFQFIFGALGGSSPVASCSVFGCMCAGGPSSATDSGSFGSTEKPPVNVWGLGSAGPYEMAVISSDTVAPLLEWIYRHGFDAPNDFVTIADDYVKDNYKFVVIRLRPEEGVLTIAPLVVQFRSDAPCVPLRLTSVAAVPDMGVLVWIVADSRAVPLNYASVAPDYTKLAVSSINTYDQLIATEVEAAGGKGWVTEFAGPVADVVGVPFAPQITNEATLDYIERGTYITRMYTKISPWEMDEDPFFQLDPTAGDVSNTRTVVVADPTASSAWSPALFGDLLLLTSIVAFALHRRRRKLQ